MTILYFITTIIGGAMIGALIVLNIFAQSAGWLDLVTFTIALFLIVQGVRHLL